MARMTSVRFAALALLVLAVPSAAPAHATTAKPAVRAAKPAAAALPWSADDYARALAEARARHVPIFVEAWAPW
jgi:hypothetical protein